MGVSRDPLDGRDKVPSSPINEEIKEEIKEEEIKPKAKPKSKSRAKPKIKIVKESVEPVEIAGVSQDPPDGRGKAPSSPIVETVEIAGVSQDPPDGRGKAPSSPIVDEKPEPHKKVDKLKEIVKCPDCSQEMTQHTLTYIHKRRGLCKADIKAAPEPEKKRQNQ